jgi:zinc protease
MNARPVAIVLVMACVAASFGVQVASAELPERPEQIAFEPLAFAPPAAKDYRHVLSDGTVVYLAESKEFPLIDLSITFKGGSSLDSAEIPGLASMTARMLREGGTKNLSPEAFDEQLDFLATQASVSAGGTFTTASMNSLKKTFDESLALFLEMLREPAFNEQRLATAKARIMADLEQRNDDASDILGREWRQLMFGDEHFEGSLPTAASVEAITPERLSAMHRQIFHPGNMIVAVSGDFDSAEMLATLEKAFGDWDRGEEVADTPVPTHELTPGVYHIPKEIPQGKVAIGMRSITRDDPDAIALDVLNDILGGGGFTSRIMRSVRSNEGLAYSASSRLSPRVDYPGEFRAGFESKNPTVALAIKIILQQINDVRAEPVTEEELETAKQSLIETFPRVFESKPQMLSVFVSDEWTDRPEGYWQTYRDRVQSVTADDVLRVARQHLDPAKMAILVVGDWEEIAAGDLDGRAKMADFFGGEVTHLPLRDPLTLEPLE